MQLESSSTPPVTVQCGGRGGQFLISDLLLPPLTLTLVLIWSFKARIRYICFKGKSHFAGVNELRPKKPKSEVDTNVGKQGPGLACGWEPPTFP